jgi:AcrR family transcriptional regulator
MTPRVPKTKRSSLPPTARRKNYHHGNLRVALIDATLKIIEEHGVENVTIREAAKRAGVSSGAPFRHFSNKTALMTGVAEQAMQRFHEEIVSALERTCSDDPFVRLHALGGAHLHWAIHNPTYFRVISDRRLIDFDGSELLRTENEKIRGILDGTLKEAERRGVLRPDTVSLLPLALSGLVYGLARMFIDGHLSQWSIAKEDAEDKLNATLQMVLNSLERSVEHS